MEEKIIKMIVYFVLAVYDDDKKTIESCIELNKLFIAMVKNEETKLDKILNLFPEQHPTAKIYAELRNNDNLLDLLVYSKEKFEKTKIDNKYLKKIEDENDVDELCLKIVNEDMQLEKELFIYNQKYNEYVANFNNIQFSIDKLPNEEEMNYMKEIAEQYKINLDKIAKYMLDENSFKQFFNCDNLTTNELIDMLGTPQIRVINKNEATITYSNHRLDSIHIITFECMGVFSKMSYLTIDG